MSDQENAITGAVVDALTKPAIPNGTVKVKAPRKRKVDLDTLHKAVQVKQPAAGRWKCDTCGHAGTGGFKLLAHSAKSGHRIFTDLDYR